jgi:hypothetical protein
MHPVEDTVVQSHGYLIDLDSLPNMLLIEISSGLFVQALSACEVYKHCIPICKRCGKKQCVGEKDFLGTVLGERNALSSAF